MYNLPKIWNLLNFRKNSDPYLFSANIVMCIFYMLYCNISYNIYVPNVELNGKTLELVKREKYLGFFVTDSFYDDEYIKNEIGNTYVID